MTVHSAKTQIKPGYFVSYIHHIFKREVCSQVIQVNGHCDIELDNGDVILPTDAITVYKCDDNGQKIEGSGSYRSFNQFIYVKGKISSSDSLQKSVRRATLQGLEDVERLTGAKLNDRSSLSSSAATIASKHQIPNGSVVADDYSNEYNPDIETPVRKRFKKCNSNYTDIAPVIAPVVVSVIEKQMKTVDYSKEIAAFKSARRVDIDDEKSVWNFLSNRLNLGWYWTHHKDVDKCIYSKLPSIKQSKPIPAGYIEGEHYFTLTGLRDFFANHLRNNITPEIDNNADKNGVVSVVNSDNFRPEFCQNR